eukprot:1151021-Pelagomonas_calceolata.AAC.3
MSLLKSLPTLLALAYVQTASIANQAANPTTPLTRMPPLPGMPFPPLAPLPGQQGYYHCLCPLCLHALTATATAAAPTG